MLKSVTHATESLPHVLPEGGRKGTTGHIIGSKVGKMGNGSERLVNSCAAKVINPKTSNTFCR